MNGPLKLVCGTRIPTDIPMSRETIIVVLELTANQHSMVTNKHSMVRNKQSMVINKQSMVAPAQLLSQYTHLCTQTQHGYKQIQHGSSSTGTVSIHSLMYTNTAWLLLYSDCLNDCHIIEVLQCHDPTYKSVLTSLPSYTEETPSGSRH